MHFVSERNQAIMSTLISNFGEKARLENNKTAMIFGISICISISTYIFEIHGTSKCDSYLKN